jgi:hypothetical protein
MVTQRREHSWDGHVRYVQRVISCLIVITEEMLAVTGYGKRLLMRLQATYLNMTQNDSGNRITLINIRLFIKVPNNFIFVVVLVL